MRVELKRVGLGTNKHLSDELLKASLKRIYSRLKGTVADPLVSPDAAKMAQSIRAVLNAHGGHLRFLPEGGDPFSIKEWVKRDDGKASILFITARSEEHTSELQSLMRISYAVFCLKKKQKTSTT